LNFETPSEIGIKQITAQLQSNMRSLKNLEIETAPERAPLFNRDMILEQLSQFD